MGLRSLYKSEDQKKAPMKQIPEMKGDELLTRPGVGKTEVAECAGEHRLYRFKLQASRTGVRFRTCRG